MDFVLNHSSSQHKWFLDSASSRTSAHRDWYIWRDGKAPGVPPNNWISDFGGSTWQFDPKTGQYYYHFFEVQQPDLNWRNPAVGKAMFDVTRFWYKNGVSGFRLDAVDLLFEDPDLHDNPVLPGTTDLGEMCIRDRAEVARDRPSHGIGSAAMGRSETNLEKGCRPGWCWNCRWRDRLCSDRVHDGKSVVWRSPARSACVSGRASPSVCDLSLIHISRLPPWSPRLTITAAKCRDCLLYTSRCV